MGTVHLAKFHGEAGFSRMLAVKRLHPQFATDPDFLCMFLDEARIASRIRHPHVVGVVDVVSHAGELLLAMEYVQGLPLSQVLRLLGPAGVPTNIAVALAGGTLQGLHAAHEAKTDKGVFLNLVHRDVSPQNVMIGEDGAARVVDFGIASAAARLQTTAEGQIKGKLAYMAPEQVAGRPVDRRADIFSAGVVLWEMLTGQRLCEGDVPEKVRFMTEAKFKKPSEIRPELPFALDGVVMKALAKFPSDRYATAEEMTSALYAARRPAHAHEVRGWLDETARPLLRALAEKAEAAEALLLPPPAAPSSPSSASHAMAPNDASLGAHPAERAAAPPSVRTAKVPRPDSSRRGPWIALVLALLAVVCVLAYVLLSRTPDKDAWPDQSAVTEEPPRPNGSPEVGKTDPAMVSGSPTPPQDSVEAPPKVEPEEDKKAASTAPKGPRPRTRPKADPCSPPYVLLKGGLKRYKPECL